MHAPNETPRDLTPGDLCRISQLEGEWFRSGHLWAPLRAVATWIGSTNGWAKTYGYYGYYGMVTMVTMEWPLWLLWLLMLPCSVSTGYAVSIETMVTMELLLMLTYGLLVVTSY